MKAIWYEHTGPAADALQFGDRPTPSPGPGEVLVRLATSGVNPSDVKTRSGRGRAKAFPLIIPHSDGAGIIEAVGEGVDRGRIGDRVWIWNGQWKRPFGTAADHIALPAEQAVHLPDTTGFEAGACLGIPALTALHALLTDGGVTGQRVLVTGGAGAVGHYAIQFARLLGARQVLATVSGAAKAAHAMAAGADSTINYREEDVPDRVMALTNGHGVDRLVDVDISGNGKLLHAILAQGGVCAAYGANQAETTIPFGTAIMRGIAIRFFIVYELTPTQRATALGTLNAWLARGLVQHAIAAILKLEDCVAAHQAVENGTTTGNVVLDCT
jgi:NADPH:quinone reductase-like Zn-dependent oxidoreductase